MPDTIQPAAPQPALDCAATITVRIPFLRWTGRADLEVQIPRATDERWRLRAALTIASRQSADLRGADLGGADLGGADLRSADLGGADLRSADLRGADLGGADLGGADLRGADLGGADLGGADLRSANLRGADLGGADLGGYKVDATIGIIQAGMPNGYDAFGYVDEKSRALRVQIGCQKREVGNGRAYWSHPDHHEGPESRREVMAALDYIEAVAKLRGWVAPAVAQQSAA